MITPLKKITVLCLARDRDATVDALQKLGLLHVVPITPPTGEDLSETESQQARTRDAIEVVKLQSAPDGATPIAPLSGRDAVKEILGLVKQRDQLSNELKALRSEATRIAPYGDFSPANLQALQARGINVSLVRVASKETVAFDEDAVRVDLSADGQTTWIAILRYGAINVKGGSREELPEQSLTSIRATIAELEQSIERANAELSVLTAAQPALEAYQAELEERVQFLSARLGMGESERVAYLQGFCPADETPRIETAAREQGWGLIVDDPLPEDSAPTLLRHPRWVKPIKAVLDVIKILPGYHEADISSVFLIFFSVFFAMLIGDAGYGLIFLALTLFARSKMKKAPAYPFAMLGLLSACTVLWGTLTGNYFGVTEYSGPLSGFRVGWLAKDKNIMNLCFIIGAVHMTIAHTWRIIKLAPSRKALEQAGWICVIWSMYFYARMLVAEQAEPPFTLGLLITGIVLIAAFMITTLAELKAGWINLAMLPLSIVSSLVDVISYIRLFAVGMASLAVAESFNNMALGIGFGNVLTGFVSALVLFLGHALNIVLCGLAVLVHGVRLNTLEFSMHMGMEWAGTPFIPLKKRVAGTQSKSDA